MILTRASTLSNLRMLKFAPLEGTTNEIGIVSAECRDICLLPPYIVTNSCPMSAREERSCSQEIENSSSSTRNSKEKKNFTNLIFKNCPESNCLDTRRIEDGERLPKLPHVEKKDYIESWILSSVTNFSPLDKSCSGSSLLEVKRKKRKAESSIVDPRWKFAKNEISSKENTKLKVYDVFEGFREVQHSVNRDQEIFERRQNDSCIQAESPQFSEFDTSSSTLNQSVTLRRLSCTKTRKTAIRSTPGASKGLSREPNSRNVSKASSVSLSHEVQLEKAEKTSERKDGSRLEDRVICRFSWCGKILKTESSPDLPRRWTQGSPKKPEVASESPRITNKDWKTSPSRILGEISNVNDEKGLLYRNSLFPEITSPSNIREESPLRWTGYGRSKDELGGREYMSFGDREKISFTNNQRRGMDSQTGSPESPSRWRGYEIRDSSRTQESLPLSSPIVGKEQCIRSSSTSEPKDNFPSEDQSTISSPLRWNNSENKNRGDISTIPETPILPSPIIEGEKIICSSTTNDSKEDDSISDYRSPTKSTSFPHAERPKNSHDSHYNTPLRWNGYKTIDSSKFSSRSSLSLSKNNELDSPRSNCDRDRNNHLQSICVEKSRVQNSLIRGKTRPIKLETIFDSENCQGRTSESSSLPDTEKLTPQLPETERIEVESLASCAPENDTKIESEIDSENDLTTSDAIENIPSQNSNLSRSRENSRESESRGITEGDFVERRSMEDDECDSDETFCLGRNPVRRPQVDVVLSGKKSDGISQLSPKSQTLSKEKSNIISQASSPSKNNEEEPIHFPTNAAARNTTKRPKKAKKGSLVAKLQSLVSLRVSDLQIWQYQMSRAEFRISRAQCVKLAIRDRETRYGRYFLIATIIEDPHNLLNSIIVQDGKNSRDEHTLTLIVVPEINGTMKVRNNDILNIYPPWEIMDRAQRVLSVIYFDVVRQKKETKVSAVQLIENERAIENFDCPCLRRGAIDNSCHLKFTNTKPSAINVIFDSS